MFQDHNPKTILNLFKILGFISALILVLTLALLPQEIAVQVSSSDKIDHFAAFAVLMMLGQLAFRARFHLALGLGLMGFGASIEVLQGLPGLNRSPDVLDWLVEVAAILMVGPLFSPLSTILSGLWSQIARR